ncbi:MAG: DnaJ domain-containing protein [Magnetococcales bacterium]|nr:DnaJ domain-containing protein [Magnetococcales bacterium]
MDPYFVLGVTREVDDDEVIRRAYLERIRQWPPERHPERFRKVSEAYTLIQTRKKRLNFNLFHHVETPDLSELESRVMSSEVKGRPSREELVGWMRALLASYHFGDRR